MSSGNSHKHQKRRSSEIVVPTRHRQHGRALLINWYDTPAVEESEINNLRTILEEDFGYLVRRRHLTQKEPEDMLCAEIESLTKDDVPNSNPVIIYYRGNGSVSHGRPFWGIDKNSKMIDWFYVQRLLEAQKADVVLVLHCDYGEVPTRNRDGEGHSVFYRLTTQRTITPCGNFDIIATPQKRSGSENDFTRIFANALKSQQNSSFTIQRLSSDMQHKRKDIIHKNISPTSTGRNIRLTKDLYSNRSVSSESSGSNPLTHNGYHSDAPEHHCNIVQFLSILQSQEGIYRTVVVQPILWKARTTDLSGIDNEIRQLCSVFERFFTFKIEEPHYIDNHKDRESLLTQKMRQFTDLSLSTALSAHDLLIVLYNGHGGDGYEFDCDMIWSNDSLGTSLVNWTRIVAELDAAPCNVVQVLDCCHSATAFKSLASISSTTFSHGHNKTSDTGYKGRNEVLAACGRDSGTATGKYSSMVLFAEVLESLARQNLPFSVHDWFHEVDSEVVRRNSQTPSLSRNHNSRENWYFSPSWKLHPRESWPRSIILRPKNAPQLLIPSSGGAHHILAQIKIQDGKLGDVTYSVESDIV